MKTVGLWGPLIPVVVAAAVTSFLLVGLHPTGAGFPLDDAWIHQVYARSLAHNWEWAFNSGQLSAGSTSPLWTVLLVPGHLFSQGYYAWAFLLGSLGLALLAVTGERVFRLLSAEPSRAFPIAGIFLAGEWHLVWAAVSGMETILFSLIILAFFLLLLHPRPQWLAVGILAGLAVWTRPDGISLAGPLFFVVWFQKASLIERVKKTGMAASGLLLLLIPYLAFNWILSGNPWPNTLYAKQAEYAANLGLPLLTRMASSLSVPMIGAGVLLLPGFAIFAWKAVRQRNPVVLAMLLWWVGFSLMYALRLPVTYQHGRYLIPGLAVFVIGGMAGNIDLWRAMQLKSSSRLLASVWQISIFTVWLVFIAIGVNAFREDVAIINTEMVQTARWVDEQTEPGAQVAAHDIGAMGFFSGRRIVDLAGLVSPEIIPILRDEKSLLQFMKDRKINYLVTFPGWYPEIVRNLPRVYSTGSPWSPAAGGENMAVYHVTTQPR